MQDEDIIREAMNLPEIVCDWFDYYRVGHGLLHCIGVQNVGSERSPLIVPTGRVAMPSYFLGRTIENATRAAANDPDLIELMKALPMRRLMS